MSRALALVVLAVVGAACAAGWRRLNRRSPVPIAMWRPLAAAAGLGTFGVALISPLAGAAEERFAAHMLQHVLMTAVAVPLVLSADPFAAIVWSLPYRGRATIGRLLAPGSPLRRIAAAMVAPGVAWTISAAVVWAWHAPVLYDLALGSEAWHIVEHVAFVAAAVVFWWPIFDPAPRVRRPPGDGTRLTYLVLATVSNGGLGLLLAAASRPFYTAYAAAPGALDDQALGGVVMWAVGGGAEMGVILLLVWRILAKSGPRALTAAGPLRENRAL